MRSCPPVQETRSPLNTGLLAAALLVAVAPACLAEGGQTGFPAVERTSAAAARTRIEGTVTDETGRLLPGARILVLGATIALAETDLAGRFSMPVLAGEYVLSAARDGYVSARRTVVRVLGGVPLRRDLTLLSLAAAAAETASADAAIADSPVEGPRETAWRLRYLPRSVLRDAAAALPLEAPEREGRSLATDRAEASDLSFWAADLSGHVDFLTTSALSAERPISRPDWPRGVAFVAVGAPVGTRGDWSIRAAMAGGELPAWTFAGEYRARRGRGHAFRVGSTYSAQTLAGSDGLAVALPTSAEVHRAGSVYASDRWRLGENLELGYAGHLDRFDYLAAPNLFGGSVEVRHALSSRLALVAEASDQRIAPGAFEFRPPSVSGIWLPPERTFSALDAERPIGAERVQRMGAGVSIALGDSAEADGARQPSLDVWRIQETSADQIAVLFADTGFRQAGHYYIGSPGSVAVDGWRVGVSGALGSVARGRVDYAITRAWWASGPSTPGPAGLLAVDDLVGHDVTSSIDATLPFSETAVTATVRVSDGFRSALRSDPGLGARFAVEVRQPLPGRALHFIVSARTLNTAHCERAGFYDELLTIAPPVRIAAGIEMQF